MDGPVHVLNNDYMTRALGIGIYESLADDGCMYWNWSCRKWDNWYKFKKGTGWMNPVSHLKGCYKVGCLQSKAREALALSADQVSLPRFFTPQTNPQEQVAVFKWMHLIIMKNLPMSIADDDEFRSFSKYMKTCSKSLRKYILNLVELVEKKIAAQLPKVFALLFDGWTEGSMHYIGLFAVYSKLVSRVEAAKTIQISVADQVLLSVSPMPALPEEDGEENEEAAAEAVAFCAKTHANYMKIILLDYYDKVIAECLVCLIGNNCNVNRKLARDLMKNMT
jgi:hypothetical protein